MSPKHFHCDTIPELNLPFLEDAGEGRGQSCLICRMMLKTKQDLFNYMYLCCSVVKICVDVNYKHAEAKPFDYSFEFLTIS